MSYTSDQLSSLNKINDLLADLEPRIFEKVKQFHVLEERGAPVLGLHPNLQPTYCVVVKIAYYSSVDDAGPFYTLVSTFPQLLPPDFVWESGAAMLHSWPALINPCSYLMHNLLQQGCQKLNDIINLSLIGVQIDVADRPFVDLQLKPTSLPQFSNGSRGQGIA